MSKSFFTVAVLATMFVSNSIAATHNEAVTIQPNSASSRTKNFLVNSKDGVNLLLVQNAGATTIKRLNVSEDADLLGNANVSGKVTCENLNLYNYGIGNLNLKYNTTGNYSIEASKYMGGQLPLNFKASAFQFDGGDMLVNGKITCVGAFDVASINANEIKAIGLKVELPNAADYVFEDNYNLKSLNEVENFIKENKHLPGMPSASEFSEQGMDVAKMSNLLLEKVEELTLHMIELQKENAALKAEVENLKK